MRKSTLEIARDLLLQQKEQDQSTTELDVAYLIEKKNPSTLYYAFHSRQDQAPTSAVVRLIQGIYATEPELSRVLVRNRIYTTAPLTTMDRGMIAVAAKRATDRVLEIDRAEHHGERSEEHKEHFAVPLRRIDLTKTENCLSTALSYERQSAGSASAHHPISAHHAISAHRPVTTHDDVSWMDLALQLTQTTRAERETKAALFLSARPVAAILVSKTGELLDWALNTNAVNKTLHAELNLVQSFYRKFKSKLPAGSKLYTTLKPCKMCAAMIHDSAEDMRTLEVIYDEDDPGTNARNTVLENIQRKLIR